MNKINKQERKENKKTVMEQPQGNHCVKRQIIF